MVKLSSLIRCPKCGFEKEEVMSKNYCQFFYDCSHCEIWLKKEGDKFAPGDILASIETDKASVDFEM